MAKRREPTPAELRRDEQYARVRRVLALIETYQDMLATHLACETWDAELVRRMISVRETVLLLIESAMPMPVAAADDDEVKTLPGAVH